jgi:hypothetical protein
MWRLSTLRLLGQDREKTLSAIDAPAPAVGADVRHSFFRSFQRQSLMTLSTRGHRSVLDYVRF